METLLAAISNGDHLAFDELFSAFQARVVGLCLAVLRDRHQAEEVAQETFLQIWQRANRFDAARGSGTAWILSLAHARTIDRVRHSQAGRARDTHYAASRHVADTDTVLESVLLTEEHAQVNRALPLLPAKQQQALGMAYFQGLDTRRIAEVLAIPIPTVKSRLHDGLAGLAAQLALARALSS